MIRVGIAGMGFMGWIHWLAYQKVPGIKVAAIHTRSKKKLRGDWRKIQGNFGPPGEQVDLSGVATYDQYKDLLSDPDIDLIDITLPPVMHAQAAIDALKAGKHVFCEKPLALNVSECRRMSKAASAAERQLLVAQMLPFTPEYAWALKTVKSGKYGKLMRGSFKRVISDLLWLPEFWITEKTGGPILDLHIHDTHLYPATVRQASRSHNQRSVAWRHNPWPTARRNCGVFSYAIPLSRRVVPRRSDLREH